MVIWGTQLFEHLPNLYYSHGTGMGMGTCSGSHFLSQFWLLIFSNKTICLERGSEGISSRKVVRKEIINSFTGSR